MAKAKTEVTEKKSPGRAPNPDAQNGVSPPKDGSASALIWKITDQLAAKAEGGKPKVGAVVEAVHKKNPDLNEATIKTQVARWRTFHGLTTVRGE